MADVVYLQMVEARAKGDIDWDAHTFKAMLLVGLTSSPLDTDRQFVADIVADEASAVGYARQTLAGITLTRDAVNDWVTLDFNDVAFGSPAAGETASVFVVYREVTNDADSTLCYAWDIADTAFDGTAFTVQVGANGAVRLPSV